MNQILKWLSGGDLRSDGLSNEVAEFVLLHPELFDELFAGLDEADDVIRGRTADALEKIARSRPDLIVDRLPRMIVVARADRVAMVKMHIAMTLGHLALYEGHTAEITGTLFDLLEDGSVFAASWAIVSLCIIGIKYPPEGDKIVSRIANLQGHRSAAIRSRAKKALHLLTNESVPFPKGWIKSEHLKALEGHQ